MGDALTSPRSVDALPSYSDVFIAPTNPVVRSNGYHGASNTMTSAGSAAYDDITTSYYDNVDTVNTSHYSETRPANTKSAAYGDASMETYSGYHRGSEYQESHFPAFPTGPVEPDTSRPHQLTQSDYSFDWQSDRYSVRSLDTELDGRRRVDDVTHVPQRSSDDSSLTRQPPHRRSQQQKRHVPREQFAVENVRGVERASVNADFDHGTYVKLDPQRDVLYKNSFPKKTNRAPTQTYLTDPPYFQNKSFDNFSYEPDTYSYDAPANTAPVSSSGPYSGYPQATVSSLGQPPKKPLRSALKSKSMTYISDDVLASGREQFNYKPERYQPSARDYMPPSPSLPVRNDAHYRSPEVNKKPSHHNNNSFAPQSYQSFGEVTSPSRDRKQPRSHQPAHHVTESVQPRQRTLVWNTGYQAESPPPATVQRQQQQQPYRPPHSDTLQHSTQPYTYDYDLPPPPPELLAPQPPPPLSNARYQEPAPAASGHGRMAPRSRDVDDVLNELDRSTWSAPPDLHQR